MNHNNIKEGTAFHTREDKERNIFYPSLPVKYIFRLPRPTSSKRRTKITHVFSIHRVIPTMRSAESDDSTDSNDSEHNSLIIHNIVEPLNWYIANHEWSTGHVSRDATNQSPRTYKHRNQQDNKSKIENGESDTNSQECMEYIKNKCHLDENKKKKFEKCCGCCCPNKRSEESVKGGDNSKKNIVKKNNKQQLQKKEKLPKVNTDKDSTNMQEKAKKKHSKNTKTAHKNIKGKLKVEPTETTTAGPSADITKSCCYLCTQNSTAIAAATLVKPIEQQTRGTQVTEKRYVKEVCSSARVMTCDRSTDCPRSSRKLRGTKDKLKNLSKYVKMIWPAEQSVACGTDTPIRRKTKRTCGTKQCRRYSNSSSTS